MEEQSVPLSDSQPKMTRRLGRGLNALLGSGTEEPQRPPAIRLHAPEQDEISVELIERNPFQPRREFDQQAIDELAESIRKHGILQPLLVRSQGGDGYQLVAGERRWRACQQIGMETVPCRVVELEDKQVCEAAIEENLKRQDLNMIEKAVAFKEYLEKFGGTIEELAKQLSMNRSTISNMLRLLDLPETVQDAVRKEQISGGHARRAAGAERRCPDGNVSADSVTAAVGSQDRRSRSCPGQGGRSGGRPHQTGAAGDDAPRPVSAGRTA